MKFRERPVNAIQITRDNLDALRPLVHGIREIKPRFPSGLDLEITFGDARGTRTAYCRSGDWVLFGWHGVDVWDNSTFVARFEPVEETK